MGGGIAGFGGGNRGGVAAGGIELSTPLRYVRGSSALDTLPTEDVANDGAKKWKYRSEQEGLRQIL